MEISSRSIDNLGRICVPKKMREALDICIDDELQLICDGEKIIISKAVPENPRKLLQRLRIACPEAIQKINEIENLLN